MIQIDTQSFSLMPWIQFDTDFVINVIGITECDRSICLCVYVGHKAIKAILFFQLFYHSPIIFPDSPDVTFRSEMLFSLAKHYKSSRIYLHQVSGSQPACRSTFECRWIVSCLPPIITFIDLSTYLCIKGCC